MAGLQACSGWAASGGWPHTPFQCSILRKVTCDSKHCVCVKRKLGCENSALFSWPWLGKFPQLLLPAPSSSRSLHVLATRTLQVQNVMLRSVGAASNQRPS